MVVLIGTWVTDHIVEPHLPLYQPEEDARVQDLTLDEKKGMRAAGFAALAYIVVMLSLVLPSGGLLRNPTTGQVLGSPFMSGIIFFMMLLFLIPGVAYGVASGKIKSSRDLTNLMSTGIAGISSFLVLLFFAAQFTFFFNKSNLGIIISVKGAHFLESVGLVGLPLLWVFILVTAFINLLIPVDTAKWAMMAPIFVPMFMHLGYAPELTQLVFRIGDSATNIITPLMPFFVMIVAYFQKYDKKTGIGSVLSTMLPYSIALLVGWILMLSLWFVLKLPIGPGAPLFYGNI